MESFAGPQPGVYIQLLYTSAHLGRLDQVTLPGFLFAEVGDVGGVMFAVPFVEEEEPVDVVLAIFRMNQGAGELFGLQRSPE